MNKLLLLIILFSFSAIARNSSGGYTGRNGGGEVGYIPEVYAKNFLQIWEDRCFGQGNSSIFHCGEVPYYREMLNPNSPEFVNSLVKDVVLGHDGEPRCMANDGANVFEYEIPCLQETLNTEDSENENRRVSLLRLQFHEYATILGGDTSDYFGFSNSVFSDLINAGYDLSIVAQDTLIPRRCSMKVENTNPASVIDHDLLSSTHHRNLTTSNNYIYATTSEQARYELKYTITCSNRMIDSCSLNYRVYDNYFNTFAHEGTEIAHRFSIRRKTRRHLQAYLLKTVFEEIGACPTAE